MNVDQLDSAENKVCAWCFGPGDLAEGDYMLAQKIALETFESEALAIANKRHIVAAQAPVLHLTARVPVNSA
jgi:hypothetical protein